MKNIETSLIKYMQDLYAHIYEGLRREIELDLINGETYCMHGLEQPMLSRCHFSPGWSISSMQSQAEYQHLDVSWCLLWTLLTKPERPMPRESAVTEGVFPGYKLEQAAALLKMILRFPCSVEDQVLNPGSQKHRSCNLTTWPHPLSVCMCLLFLKRDSALAEDFYFGQTDLENFLSLSGNLGSCYTHPGLDSQRPLKYNLALSWEPLSTGMWLLPLSFFSCLLNVLLLTEVFLDVLTCFSESLVALFSRISSR